MVGTDQVVSRRPLRVKHQFFQALSDLPRYPVVSHAGDARSDLGETLLEQKHMKMKSVFQYPTVRMPGETPGVVVQHLVDRDRKIDQCGLVDFAQSPAVSVPQILKHLLVYFG